jgi:tRNA nucleotidyltransferase (CCA-adding enzyme)
MSDYLFMLESHLDATQSQAVAAISDLADKSGVKVWLTGGAMRNMLRGIPSRDLDFTVERGAIETGKALADALGAQVTAEDPLKRWVELELPGGITASVANARTEKCQKPGGKPQIAPATIHEDLMRRDFTIDAIALSLSRNSRGLLVDPANGQADLMSRELRTTHSSAFFDDPTRLFRFIRLRHQLALEVVPRTLSQFENAIAEGYQDLVGPEVLGREIRALWSEASAVAALEDYDSSGLLTKLSPGFAGGKWNPAGLTRLAEIRQSIIPPGTEGGWLSFVAVLTEKIGVRDRAEALKSLGMDSDAAAALKNLFATAQQLEADLASPRMRRPSDVWNALRTASTDEILIALCRSKNSAVEERVRAYYEKYAPIAAEITDADVAASGAAASGAAPGTAKFEKARSSLIVARLNAKPPKEEPELEPAI